MKPQLSIKTASLTLAALLCATAASAETVIRYSNWLPPTHQLHQDVMVPWGAKIAEVTEGRVRLEVVPKVVGTMPTQFDVVRDGLADAAIFVPGQTPGRFPLIELVEMPLFEDDPVIMAPATHRVYEEQLAQYDEFRGVKVLSVFTTTAGHVLTSKKPVETLEDFRGLKLRTALASQTFTVEALGATPVQKAPGEIYELMTAGTLDGTLLSREGIVSYNLLDVASNITIVPGGVYNNAFVVAINEDTWNEISPEDRARIEEISGEVLARAVGEAYRAADDRAVAAMEKEGTHVTVASGDFLEGLRAALAPVEGNWTEVARQRGVEDPEAILAWFKADLQAARAATD